LFFEFLNNPERHFVNFQNTARCLGAELSWEVPLTSIFALFGAPKQNSAAKLVFMRNSEI